MTTTGVAVDVETVLRGEAGVAGVRELALAPLTNGLVELLGECAPESPGDWSMELVRTKYKPGRKLDAYYRLPASSGHRFISVTWSVDASAPPLLADIEHAALTRSLLGPFRRLGAASGDGRVALLIAPADPSMPQLVRLSDPRYLSGLLAAMTRSASGRSGVGGVRAVRYRPGQRHVLTILGSGGRALAFVKLQRDDSGERAVRIAEAAGTVVSQGCPGVRLVRPLGYSSADRASVWMPAGGMTLWESARADGSVLARQVGLVGGALRALHDSGIDRASLLKDPSAPVLDRDAEDEVRATVRAGEHICALLPSAGSTFRMLLEDLSQRLSRLPPESPALIHGDAKGDNIIVDDDSLCLLDLDRCTGGDPALDLGKFLADMRWWCGRLGLNEDVLSAAFGDAYGECSPARWARARLVAVLFQLKLAARRAAVHDIAWTVDIHRAVADAAARLGTEDAR
jgi:aminoglycoside phosphotransferase